MNEKRSLVYKIALLSLLLIISCSLLLSVLARSNPANITVIPVMPNKGKPIILTYTLGNPLSEQLPTYYELYIDGRLATSGHTIIPGDSIEIHQYIYEWKQPIGTRNNFALKVQSRLGNSEEVISVPPFAPQLWSSFASIAAFSTTVMSSIVTSAYYRNTFVTQTGPNIGMVVSLTLILLLILSELTRPALMQSSPKVLGVLMTRFATLQWILLIIFAGIVITTIFMIISPAT